MVLLSNVRVPRTAVSFPERGRRRALQIGMFVAICGVVLFSRSDDAGRNLGHLGPQADLLRGGLIGVAHSNSDLKPYLLSSTDGAEFHAIAGPLTSGDRDPSLTFWDGKYWMAATQPGSARTFDVWVATDPTDVDNWTHTVVDVGGIGTVYYTWAPEWFIDPTHGLGYEQVHIFFSATTRNSPAGPFRLYEVHPVNPDLTRWSTPFEVTGTSLPVDQIDPFMVYAPEIGTAGKPYKLWYKDNNGSFIEYMESAGLTTGYSVVQSGNWAGWKGFRSIEAVCLIRLDDGSWRAYFNENAGYTTVGNFYSDSLDDWATWTVRARVNSANLMSHGTYIRVALVPGIRSASLASLTESETPHSAPLALAR